MSSGEQSLHKLQKRLGYIFRDTGLLNLALTHPSVAHDEKDSVQTNQRLEFLGDAVLQLILTRELYDHFPAVDEGPLTKARARLVNRRTLYERAAALGLGQHLIVSRGEEKSGGRERPSALADTFEAVLGAIYLDGGYEASRAFVLAHFQISGPDVPAIPLIDNPKGELQELLQSLSNESPRYSVVSTSGPDHDRVFECTVTYSGRELASGKGRSKKAAESEAARLALIGLREELAKEDPTHAHEAASPAKKSPHS